MEGRQASRRQGLWRSAWRALGSSRLAAILLCIVLLASLVGTLFPQTPTDAASRQAWAQAVGLHFGGLASLFASLGMFTYYRTPWFLALLAALLLNVLACTVQRVPRILRSLAPLRTRAARHLIMPESFYQECANHAEWSVPSLIEGTYAAQGGLGRHGYAVYIGQSQESAYLYAERYLWTEGCTLVSHLVATLLVLAIAARPALTWTDQGIRLLPGGEYAVGRGLLWAIRVGELTIERGDDGQTLRYQAPVSLLGAPSPQSATSERPVVGQRIVGTGRPYRFGGIWLHLQGYGPAVEVTLPAGSHAVALADGRPQEITLSEVGVTLRLRYQPAGRSPSAAQDPVGQKGPLFAEAYDASGNMVAYDSISGEGLITAQGVPIRLGLVHYTDWQVSHDPTFGPAVAAGAVLAASAGCSLWLPRRRVWLRLVGSRAQMASPDVEEVDTLARDCQWSGNGGVSRAP